MCVGNSCLLSDHSVFNLQALKCQVYLVEGIKINYCLDRRREKRSGTHLKTGTVGACA